jgi:CO/xanthine dehydrogenase Mo-binding subunit
VAEVERIDLDAVAREELRPGERLGTGYAMFAEGTGLGPYEVGRVALLPSGRFEVSSGAASSGQGHETTLAQVAADELAVPLESVAVTRCACRGAGPVAPVSTRWSAGLATSPSPGRRCGCPTTAPARSRSPSARAVATG